MTTEPLRKVNLAEKLTHVHEHWSPRLVGELNGQHVRIAKVKGEFVWHHHDDEDELFLVLHGRLVLELRDGRVELGEGEMCIVPRGVEHRPVAEDEAHLLLFEPATTRNTGNVTSDLTVERVEPL